MTISNYTRTEDYEVTYVRGGEVHELVQALSALTADGFADCSWRVENDAIVLVCALGATEVPREIA